MKSISVFTVIASAAMLLTACGGSPSGDDLSGSTVGIPVGQWGAQAEGSLVRQLYVLPPLADGMSSQAWAIQSEIVGGVPVPRLLAFGELEAGATSLTGSGRLENLATTPSTNTVGDLVVTPSVAGDSLTLAAAGATWSLNALSPQTAGVDSQLWTGDFRSSAEGGVLVIDWGLSMTGVAGTLIANDDIGCTYEGALTSVGDDRLPNVVRLSYQSTNSPTGIPSRQECGDWSGMGTVARNQQGEPVGRTLWLRRADGSQLQRVSLEAVDR